MRIFKWCLIYYKMPYIYTYICIYIMHFDYLHSACLPSNFHELPLTPDCSYIPLPTNTMIPFFFFFWFSSCIILLLIAPWVQLILPICLWIQGQILDHGQPTSSHITKGEWLSLPRQQSCLLMCELQRLFPHSMLKFCLDWGVFFDDFFWW